MGECGVGASEDQKDRTGRPISHFLGIEMLAWSVAFLEHLVCLAWTVSRQYLACAEVNINMVYCASGPRLAGVGWN